MAQPGKIIQNLPLKIKLLLSLSHMSVDTVPDKIACSHLVVFISYYKEMEGDTLFQLPSLSQLIIHFCPEFKIEKNIRQFAYYVAFTSFHKTLWWEPD